MGWFFVLRVVELADVVGFKRATLTEAKSYWLSNAQMQHYSSGASRAGSWGPQAAGEGATSSAAGGAGDGGRCRQALDLTALRTGAGWQEVIFFTESCMRLCFGFVTKAVLVTPVLQLWAVHTQYQGRLCSSHCFPLGGDTAGPPGPSWPKGRCRPHGAVPSSKTGGAAQGLAGRQSAGGRR